MFHFFIGKLYKVWKKKLIKNDMFGIEVTYEWSQKEGEYHLYPYIDDNKKTIAYYAFDTNEQKSVFEDLLKINWIWPKTAFHIAQLPQENLQKAIKNFDAKFFQSIPGIWPKTAKKMLLELKDSFDLEDIQKIDIDQRLYKDIVKSLKWFGYDGDRVKSALQKYDGKISKENMSEVIKRLISEM